MNHFNKLITLLDNAKISYQQQPTFWGGKQIIIYKNHQRISDVVTDPMNMNYLEYMGPCEKDDVINHLTAEQAFQLLKKDSE